MRVPLKDQVWDRLHRAGAPDGFRVQEDGPDVIVRYPDSFTPLRRPNADGVIQLVGEVELERCREILSADPSLSVELVRQPDFRYHLRVKDTAPPFP